MKGERDYDVSDGRPSIDPAQPLSVNQIINTESFLKEEGEKMGSFFIYFFTASLILFHINLY